MNGIKIFVDFKEVDCGKDPVTLPITYQLIDIKQIEKRKGSTTKTVRIPRTKKNDKIFGFAFDINAENKFDKYSEHFVVIEQDTFPIFNGFLKLTNVDDDIIEFFCYADISKLKDLFGEKTLQELNLQDLDHIYDATIFDTWDGVYPSGVPSDYIYPLIDYGRFQTLTPANDPEEPDLLLTDFYPALYEERAVRQIVLDNGYSLVSDFYKKPIPSKTIIPFVNDQFIHSVVGGIEVNGVWAWNPSQQTADVPESTYILTGASEISDPLSQWDGDEFTAAGNYTLKYELGLQVEFPSFDTFLNAPSYFVLQVDRGSGYVEERREPIERPNQDNIFNGLYTGALNVATGDKIRFGFEFIGGVAELLISAKRIILDPSFGGLTIEPGEFVQIAPNLPKIKQVDFIKSCYQRYNWIINVDDNKGTIEIETFEDFYFGGDQKDWSDLLTLNPKPKVKYMPEDYSKKYDFKYKRDPNDFYLTRYDTRLGNSEYLFGDGKFYLTDKGEATLIGEVCFAPTIVEKSFAGGVNYIDLPTMLLNDDPENKNTGHEPRVLIYAGLVGIDKLSNGVYSNLYVEDLGSVSSIPFAYFQKKPYNDATLDAMTANLSFSTPSGGGYIEGNLIDEYYSRSLKSISVSPQVTAYLNLTSKQISELNFRDLIFLNYFSAKFRIKKIVDYLPGSTSPTKVELIKVGIFNPNKQNYD